jgi:excisionase family DNA binding protein
MAADIAQVLTRQQIADQMLTWQQTAELLNMRPQTLAVWAMSGKFLPFVKLGRTVRYRLSDVQKLIEQRTVGGQT